MKVNYGVIIHMFLNRNQKNIYNVLFVSRCHRIKFIEKSSVVMLWFFNNACRPCDVDLIIKSVKLRECHLKAVLADKFFHPLCESQGV